MTKNIVPGYAPHLIAALRRVVVAEQTTPVLSKHLQELLGKTAFSRPLVLAVLGPEALS